MTASKAAFSQEEISARRYRGMNPAFVRRVWAKRRQERSVAPPPVVVKPKKKTIGQILAERANERRLRIEAERVARLKAKIEEGGVSAIIAEVALAHHVTVEDILGEGRSRALVKIRHQAIVEVAIRRPAFSLTQIGKFFRRDHTTILAVLKKHKIRGWGNKASV